MLFKRHLNMVQKSFKKLFQSHHNLFKGHSTVFQKSFNSCSKVIQKLFQSHHIFFKSHSKVVKKSFNSCSKVIQKLSQSHHIFFKDIWLCIISVFVKMVFVFRGSAVRLPHVSKVVSGFFPTWMWRQTIAACEPSVQKNKKQKKTRLFTCGSSSLSQAPEIPNQNLALPAHWLIFLRMFW